MELYKSIGILLLIVTLVFSLVSPFTIIHARTAWLTIMGTVADIIGRHPDTPFTFQFIGTIPYLYQLQTISWQTGLVGILGLIGLLRLLITGLINKKSDRLLFAVFPALYFLSSGLWLVKFVRYNMPFLFPATIAAAWLLTDENGNSGFWKRILLVITAFTLVFWGLSNWTIYILPQTRITASYWIYQNIPQKSVLVQEGPYENLPLKLPGTNPQNYKYEIIDNIYDPDSPQKIASISARLQKGDYLIFVTSRQWMTLPKLTQRYPFTSRLYQNIIDEKSGYLEVARFTSYPRLFGLEINDDHSEETNRIFDHSLVRIFKNIK